MDSIKFPSKSVLGEHGRLVSGNAVKNATFSAFGDPSAIQPSEFLPSLRNFQDQASAEESNRSVNPLVSDDSTPGTREMGGQDTELQPVLFA
jgi:hypothetical protein